MGHLGGNFNGGVPHSPGYLGGANVRDIPLPQTLGMDTDFVGANANLRRSLAALQQRRNSQQPPLPNGGDSSAAFQQQQQNHQSIQNQQQLQMLQMQQELQMQQLQQLQEQQGFVGGPASSMAFGAGRSSFTGDSMPGMNQQQWMRGGGGGGQSLPSSLGMGVSGDMLLQQQERLRQSAAAEKRRQSTKG